VLMCGSILQQADRYCREGLHPRIVVDGLEVARDKVLEFLKNEFAIVPEGTGKAGLIGNRELLHHVALTSLRTKLDASLAGSVRLKGFANEILLCIKSVLFVLYIFFALHSSHSFWIISYDV